MPKPENVKPFEFKKGQSGNPNGRPLKIYTILKKQGYSKDDVKAAFNEMGFYTLEDLKKVHTDETKPVITRIIANQYYLALKKGDWTKIKEILEHTIGKPKQETDITSGGNPINSEPVKVIFGKKGMIND